MPDITIKTLKFIRDKGEYMESLLCVRCGHKWYQRKPQMPRNCAKCKARYWNRPARMPKPDALLGPVGRPCKYPVYNLEVRGKMILPWNFTPDGKPDHNLNQGMNRAIMNYARKSGKKFRRDPMYQGLIITRVA